jgi:hypothetical protein
MNLLSAQSKLQDKIVLEQPHLTTNNCVFCNSPLERNPVQSISSIQQLEYPPLQCTALVNEYTERTEEVTRQETTTKFPCPFYLANQPPDVIKKVQQKQNVDFQIAP